MHEHTCVVWRALTARFEAERLNRESFADGGTPR